MNWEERTFFISWCPCHDERLVKPRTAATAPVWPELLGSLYFLVLNHPRGASIYLGLNVLTLIDRWYLFFKVYNFYNKQKSRKKAVKFYRILHPFSSSQWLENCHILQKILRNTHSDAFVKKTALKELFNVPVIFLRIYLVYQRMLITEYKLLLNDNWIQIMHKSVYTSFMCIFILTFLLKSTSPLY